MNKHNNIICTVCLSKYNLKSVIKCHFCNTSVCKVCFLDYLDYCKKDCIYPICISSECTGCFLFKDVAYILKEKEIYQYYTIILNVILKNTSKTLNELDANNNLISNIKKNRISFLEKEAGKGVMIVINAIYKDELSKILSKYKKSIKEKNKKTCIKLMCKGYLISYRNYLRCILCKTKVCILCEKEHLIKHKCNPNDIKSVNIMNNIVKCICGSKMSKYTGCNHMTCTVCGQGFNHKTGAINRILTEEYDLSTDTDTLAHLRLFEKSKPKIPNKNDIIKIANYIKKKRDSDVIVSKSDCIRLCLSIEKYKKDKDKYKKYIYLSDKVEKALIDKDHKTAQKLMFDSI